MNALPEIEEEYVRRFIDSLCLGDRDAATVYREVARNLLRFVRKRFGRTDLSRKALVAWMKHRLSRSSLHRIENHARMADRFLDWMKKNDHLPSNPFQDLRSQYGRYSGPIVRALLSNEP